jgi:hypothetical protein
MGNWYVIKDENYYNKNKKKILSYAKNISELLDKPFMYKFFNPHNKRELLPDIYCLSLKESKNLEEKISQEKKISIDDAKKRGDYITEFIFK